MESILLVRSKLVYMCNSLFSDPISKSDLKLGLNVSSSFYIG